VNRGYEIELRPIVEQQEFMRVALDHFCELNPAFKPAPDWQDNYFATIRGNSDCWLQWILLDGEKVGFVLFGIEKHRFLPRRTGAIYELYISPNQRRKGIARSCAELVLAELRKYSPSKIQLEVIEGNQAAARLWQHLGFSKVSERFTLALD
jgi:ribosomal protein S18 acetylase RimI-like enzyme